MKREESKLRAEDEKVADLISSFLDKYFYIEKNGITNTARINEKEEQVKGIDIVFNLNEKHYICDEKAAIRYINKPLSTFSMELSFIDRGNNIHDGWLLDKTKINNSFLLCWIDKADKDNIENINEIKELHIILVSRDKIIQYLEEKGWTKDKLKKKGKRLRINKSENCGNLIKHGLKFSVSNQLVEKPVNVLLSRTTLKRISDFNIVIKND